MKPGTDEWIEKAEADFDVVNVLRRSRKPRRFDAIGFHCQQCVEKYLKARLHESGIAIPKTHDLGLLLKLCLPYEPLLAPMKVAFDDLTTLAVEARYPGEWTDRETAQAAYQTCLSLRELARQSLGLPTSRTRKKR